jgi:hypothetical protein
MAKLKKAPGRVIGRWKQEAIAANAGASDEDLAKIINETARKLGFDYTITPEKVRGTTTKKRKKAARKSAPAAAATAAHATPTPKPATRGDVSMADVRAVRELIDRVGARTLQELVGMLGR